METTRLHIHFNGSAAGRNSWDNLLAMKCASAQKLCCVCDMTGQFLGAAMVSLWRVDMTSMQESCNVGNLCIQTMPCAHASCIDVPHKDFQMLHALHARVNGLGSAHALTRGIYTQTPK